mmetsp:Transcript_12983/g.30630  ORF Transcript_12983/g.30630 Transcript_12983/m.30630 type:complete len:110 (-) Transcript_12983:300-629(-)
MEVDKKSKPKIEDNSDDDHGKELSKVDSEGEETSKSKKKGDPHTSKASHTSKPLRDLEVLPSDFNTGRRRSRRGRIAEQEPNARDLEKLKQSDPSPETRHRRRSNRLSR